MDNDLIDILLKNLKLYQVKCKFEKCSSNLYV